MWPKTYQWKKFFKILSRKEKIVFSALFLFFLFFLISSVLNFYYKNTELKPAQGGAYIEGVLGRPNRLNPIYALTNDVDRDIGELIFSGLMKYGANGELLPDLAKDYKVLENGKIFEFYLKEKLFWSDSKVLTPDDIIFTIKIIQSPDYKSPLRANWIGVEIEKIADNGIRFKLKNSSAIFLENTTLKILPKHIWQNVTSQEFPLSPRNLEPIGSGPYKLKKTEQNKERKISSLDLVRNPYFAGAKPNINQISFKFFDSEKELLDSYNSGKIKGFAPISFNNLANLTNLADSANIYNFSLPRYFAVFLNPEKSKILKEKSVKQALNYGVNKAEFVQKLALDRGKTVDSPILPNIFGFNAPNKIYQFDESKAKEILEKDGFLKNESGQREKIINKNPAFQLKSDIRSGSQEKEVEELQRCLAKFPDIYPEGEITGYFGPKTKNAVIKFQEKYSKEILDPSGFKSGTGLVASSTRKKLNELCFAPSEEKMELSFSLATANQPELEKAAILLKEQWLKLGISINIEAFDIATLEREIIKPRNYEILLFGEVLGTIPDPFPFWHSSQKKDPGLNLALYENKEVDKLLEEARQNLNEDERRKKLEKFQDILQDDSPAIFLYNPDYIYLVSKEIKQITPGVIADPSKRFSQIEEWHIKTKRVWR